MMEVILPPRKDDSVREAPGSASPTLVSPATDTISSGTGGTGHGYNTSDNRSRRSPFHRGLRGFGQPSPLSNLTGKLRKGRTRSGSQPPIGRSTLKDVESAKMPISRAGSRDSEFFGNNPGSQGEDESDDDGAAHTVSSNDSRTSPVRATFKRLSGARRRFRGLGAGGEPLTLGRVNLPRSSSRDCSGNRSRAGSVDASFRKLPDEFLGTTGRPPLSNAAANDSVAAPAMARGKTVPTSFGREAAGAEGLDQGGQQAKQENVNMTQGQLRRMSVSPKGRTQKKRDRSRSPAAKPEVSNSVPSLLGSPAAGSSVADSNGPSSKKDFPDTRAFPDWGSGVSASENNGSFPSNPGATESASSTTITPSALQIHAAEDGGDKTAAKQGRRLSWQSGNQIVDKSESLQPTFCSILKFGDKLMLRVRPVVASHLRVPSEDSRSSPPQGEDLREREPGEDVVEVEVVNGSDSKATSGSGLEPIACGYVGSCVQNHREARHRHEVVLIGKPCDNHGEYADCDFHASCFQAVDPTGQRKDGDAVCLGDVILLVDHHNLVWNENAHGMPGTLRMKPRKSKKQVAVSFRLPGKVRDRDVTEDERQPVIFGTEGLEIFTEELEGKEGSRRRRSTKKRGVALSAHFKKSGNELSLSEAYLAIDGRGTPLLFELHPHNNGLGGDSSPFVTKVTIHPVEQASVRLSPTPNAMPRIKSGEPSQRSTISTISTAQLSEGSVASSAERARRMLKDTEAMFGESPGTRSSSLRTSEMSLKEEIFLEDAGASERLGWGEYVPFRMPTEQEVKPDDVVMTVSLSNGMVVSLTSEQLRRKAGKGEFSVEVRTKGGLQDLAESSNAGVVFFKCELTPISYPHEGGQSTAVPEAVAKEPEKTRTSTVLSWVGETGEILADYPKKFGPIEGSLWGSVDGKYPWKNYLSKYFKTWMLRSFLGLLCFVMMATVFATGSMLVKSMTLRRNRVRPCSTVWDLRQPDGTAYPEHQLAAAAAAFDAAARVRSPGLRRLTTFDASDMHDTAQRETWATNSAPQSTRSGEESQFHVKVGEGSTGADGVHYHGERDDTMAKYELEAVRQANDGPCNIQRGLHRESTIGRDNEDTLDEVGVVARSWSLRAEGWKGSTAKALVASAIGTLAALVFLVMLGLFGWGQRESSANESRPMQAQVHLLRWSQETASEASAEDSMHAAEAIDVGGKEGSYVDPPNGSELSPMPYRFVLAENLDMEKAWQRWENTLAWRKENGADDVLSRPHPKYALIKSKYMHCFHLADKHGRLTYYERPGISEMRELKKMGVTREEMIEHYMYCMEYLWQVLQPSQSQRITVIIDLAGVRMMDIAGESLSFLKTTVSMMSRHYPQRSFKILILNAPSFFNGIFSMIKPMLNEATKKKIDLLPAANAATEMLKIIPAENLPVQYGGTSEVSLMKSEAEAALLAHTQKVLQDTGTTMDRIL